MGCVPHQEPSPKERNILDAISRLSSKTPDGNAPVSDIFKEVGGSMEYLRTALYKLKLLGLVENPAWGRYRVVEVGE